MSELELEAIRLSLEVATAAVLGSLPIAILVAWVLARKEFPGKSILDGVVHLPLILPPVVVGYLLLVTLGRNGVIGGFLFDVFGITLAFTWKGAAVAAAVVAFPLIVRSIRLSPRSGRWRIGTGRANIGASPSRVFATVTLPLASPGILTGSILGFARSLGEFGATITFVSNIPAETRTLPIALYTLTQVPGGEMGALRLVVISIVVALAALVVSRSLPVA